MLARLTVTTGLGSVALAMAGISLAGRGLIPPMAGLGLFVSSGLMGLLALICTTTVLFRARHYGAALVGAMGLLPLLAVAGAAAQGARYPAINDIATDLEQVPAFVHAASLPENAGRDLSFPAAFAPVIRERYPDVAPLTLPLPPDQAYARAVSIARTNMAGWTVTHEDAAGGVFEAVAATRVFKWKDDIVVRISPAEGGSRVDMRSKSREGKSDLGANARRIRKYFAALALKL